MPANDAHSRHVGLLFSGGLDSSILLSHLLAEGRRVQPFYIRSQLVWQAAEEKRAARGYLAAVDTPRLDGLVTLELPLADLYGRHWSTTGEQTPDDRSPDEAVFLPGRNALLAIKPAIWCQMHGIEHLALATLAGNPFADATDAFFADFQTALGQAMARPLSFVRSFEQFDKRQVMRLGRDYPLGRTFSCIAPEGWLHCGHCNKCAERRLAFAQAGIADSTPYAESPRPIAQVATCGNGKPGA